MSKPQARQLLVDMLHQAAELEHSLLSTYIFAACSLKSLPSEFASIGGVENRRRAPQFERARMWKASILEVAHEEMRHLHYVQCLIRALGERPHLGLPARGDDGVWKIPNWRIRVGEQPHGEDGTEIPVERFGEETIRNFILYESTDSLQDADPFGPEAMDLYHRLYEFEFELRIASTLADMPASSEPEKKRKDETLEKLRTLYRKLTPTEGAAPQFLMAELAKGLPPLKKLRFQSIADFYQRGILPLYETAFEQGWVVVTDRNLVDEQLDPNYAGQGFLPVGPIGRSARFARFSSQNIASPLKDYKRVDDIIDEIVEQGEGLSQFVARSEAMLEKIGEIGIGGFMGALAADKAGERNPDYQTPDWLNDAQLLRNSHLYKFAMIFVELEEEQELARSASLTFSAARDPIEAGTVGLRKVGEELPAQFNAAYLAMLAWLSRMYETRDGNADKPRRLAIEMLATWPLMSLAIRPMLELASFFEVDLTKLFRFGEDDLPMLPIWGQQLVGLYRGRERSEAINEQMDYLIVRTLRGVSEWAAEKVYEVNRTVDEPARAMILRRLKALRGLAEFEVQFPFRMAGGYSNRMPDLTYQATHEDADRFSESPTPDPLYADSAVLRLRFAGRSIVQLATDPDPPTDESGATGTHMLHSADGEQTFDRALVFQELDAARTISRDAPGVPSIGVNCIEVSLLVPDLRTGASAGYFPIQVMNSRGAVDTSGVQQKLQMTGLNVVATLSADEVGTALGTLHVNLEEKDGVRPFLNGDNHLVWQDGEPIDPFILTVSRATADGKPEPLLGREIFNEGLTITQMNPLQRLVSSRAPVGFDEWSNVPGWARTEPVKAMIEVPGYPISFLKRRSRALADELANVGGEWTRDEVDVAVSLAERCIRVARPRGTTVGWLTALLHYGHTVSGAVVTAPGPELLELLSKATGVPLAARAPGSRGDPDERWTVSYTKGLMDTDTLSDFTFGELYVPLAFSPGPGRFGRSWGFAAEISEAVAKFACAFDQPSWAKYDVSNDMRTVNVEGLDPAEPNDPVKLTETLVSSDPASYAYSLVGLPGLSECKGRFSIADEGDRTGLRWQLEYNIDEVASAARCLSWMAKSADAMASALGAHFLLFEPGTSRA